MAAPWAMATMINGASGMYDFSDECLGPVRKRLSNRPSTASLMRGLPMPVFAPTPDRQSSDMGIVDGPNLQDLQRFSTASIRVDAQAGKARPSTAKPYAQRSTSQANLFASGQRSFDVDARIRASVMLPPRRTESNVLKHLQGAQPTLAKEQPPLYASLGATPQHNMGSRSPYASPAWEWGRHGLRATNGGSTSSLLSVASRSYAKPGMHSLEFARPKPTRPQTAPLLRGAR